MKNVSVRSYSFYKNRFTLSLSISILVHLLIIFIFYKLPSKEHKTVLRPISLGLLQQNKTLEHIESNISKQDSKERSLESKKLPLKKTPANKIQRADSKTQPTKPIKPKISESSESSKAPDINVDINSLKIQNKDFNPLATPTPSLSETLRNNIDNSRLENLPSSVKGEIYKLYGTELEKMSKEEKNYLAQSYFMNVEVFQQTADRMGYPKLAAYLKQQGRGVIEFTLHPDGHIDNIKIVYSTGFETLDDSMRQVVELSAKNLKRPPKPLKVRLGGNYTIRP